MEKIVKKAGYTLSQALEIFNRTKILTPFLVGYKENNSEVKINSKDIILELSIPKVVSEYERNSKNLKSACVVFPAEIAEINGVRISSLIIMVQNYKTNEHLVISQPYKFINNKIELSEFELFDYCPQLEPKLPILEANFLKGILDYEGAEDLWSKRFKAS